MQTLAGVRQPRAIIDCGNNGPDLGGIGGIGAEIGAVLCLGGTRAAPIV